MTVACIVQARMGSKRFPGKVLAPLAGKPVLQHVLEKCKEIDGVDEVVCAIPYTPENEILYELAWKWGVKSWLGSEDDVLSRYVRARIAVEADTIMRITADCPLIDPDVCGNVLKLFQESGADYASNVLPRTFPQGLDCEVFSMKTLTMANAEATDAYDREHVTPIMQRADIKRVNYSQAVNLSALRWTVDYPDDIPWLESMMRDAA